MKQEDQKVSLSLLGGFGTGECPASGSMSGNGYGAGATYKQILLYDSGINRGSGQGNRKGNGNGFGYENKRIDRGGWEDPKEPDEAR